MKKEKLKKVIKLILIILWMIIVFCFSAQPGTESTGTSRGFIARLLDISMKFVNLDEIAKENVIVAIEPIVRKFAHFTLYTIGGIVIINYISTYKLKKKKEALISLLIGALYACTDEFHQFFVEGRSASIIDVGIDSLGIITGIGIFLIISIFINKIKDKVSYK